MGHDRAESLIDSSAKRVTISSSDMIRQVGASAGNTRADQPMRTAMTVAPLAISRLDGVTIHLWVSLH